MSHAFCAWLFLFILARGAHAEEFELVADSREPVRSRNPLLQISHPAFLDFHHLRASCADQVMMMAVVPFPQQLKTRGSVAKIITLHQSHVLQKMHGAVNSREVALGFWQGFEEFLDRHRMRAPGQSIED